MGYSFRSAENGFADAGSGVNKGSKQKKRKRRSGGMSDNPVRTQPRRGRAGIKHGSSHRPVSEIASGSQLSNSNSVATHSRKRKKASSKIGPMKYRLRSFVDGVRVLRSRSHASPHTSPSGSVKPTLQSTAEKVNRRKRKRINRVLVDEFDKSRSRLRYLLHRINFEQSLLDAYSAEGWKNQNSEKVKPEKELERASAQIMQCKLKIRGLFENIEKLCTQGRFHQSLFDSEGQIDSEDIFCAKCGSKELTADNDIILCDGFCDRGFHQMCLDPPLLMEQIPSDDEGWLCPGCDCKVDCINLLNEILETDLSFEDGWENIFPEATAVTTGDKVLDILELPSDDSEDYDYTPKGQAVDGDELCITSQSSDCTSASDSLNASKSNKQIQSTGFSSDEAEDNNYEPNHMDSHGSVQDVNTCSDDYDFSSDTDDLADFDAEHGFVVSDGFDTPVSLPSEPSGIYSKGRSSRGKKRNPLNTEVTSLLEKDEGSQSSLIPLGKRVRERLDYKKLYEEEYGKASSDSSDDENWTDIRPRKRKRHADRSNISGVEADVKIRNFRNGKHPGASARSTKRGARNSSCKEIKNSFSKVRENDKSECSPHLPSGGHSTARHHLKQEAHITKRLLEVLKENKYPGKDEKDKLSEELGITPQQVSKWLLNARCRLRRCSKMEEDKANTRTSTTVAVPIGEVNACPEVESSGLKSTVREMREPESRDLVIVSPESSDTNEKPARTKRRGKKFEGLYNAVAAATTPMQTATTKAETLGLKMRRKSWQRNDLVSTPLYRPNTRRRPVV